MYKILISLLLVSSSAFAQGTIGIQDLNAYNCSAKTSFGELTKTAVLADSEREAIKLYSMRLQKLIVVSDDAAQPTEKFLILMSEDALSISPGQGLVVQALTCTLVVPATK